MRDKKVSWKEVFKSQTKKFDELKRRLSKPTSDNKIKYKKITERWK